MTLLQLGAVMGAATVDAFAQAAAQGQLQSRTQRPCHWVHIKVRRLLQAASPQL